MDTPGFADSEGRDQEHTNDLIEWFKKLFAINAFIVCLNSEDSRIDQQKQAYLKLLGKIFGPKFYDNVLICFTKWRLDRNAERERKKGTKLTEESMKKQVQEDLKAKLGISLENDQFAFIDNMYTHCSQEDNDDIDPQEYEKYQA